MRWFAPLLWLGESVAVLAASAHRVRVRRIERGALAGLTLGAISVVAQTTVYWDTNGSTGGSSGGSTAPGTWDQNTTANWSTNINGTAGTGTWQNRSGGSGIAVFAAGTNATAPYSVTVSGTITGLRGITADDSDLTLTGGTLSLGGNMSVAGTHNLTVASNLNLGGGNRVLTVTNSGVTEFSGVVSNSWYANITKDGAGTLVLSGANTFTGPMLVNAGALELRNSSALGGATSGNTVAAGAELRLNGGITVNESSFTVQGTGTTGSGVLRNVAGANTLGGTVSFANSSTIGLDAGSLTLSGTADLGSGYTITVAGAGDMVFGGVIGGSSALVLNSTGTVTFGGTSANYNSGGVTVNSGTLLLAKSAGTNAAQTPITVNGATLRLGASNQIADYVGVTLGGTTSLFDLNGFSDTINSLAMTGSSVTTGAGTLSVNATGITTSASSTTSTITGNLGLAGGATTFSVANGGSGLDLSLGAIVSGGGGIVKSGTGVMLLSGLNTYTGATTVSQGTLLLGGSAPSGAAGTLGNATSTVTLNDANTGVNNTALLVTTAGTTINRAINATNNGTGTTTLGTDASLASGTVSLTGNITVNRSITLQAAGSTNLNIGTGVISGAGGITKTGTGTLTLSGTNTYTGATTISQGTVLLGGAAPNGAAGTLGNATSAVTINDANTGTASTGLMLSTAATVGRALSIANAGSGTTTIGGDASLTAGTATFSGNVAMNRSIQLQAAGTSTVTFSGVMSGAGGITKIGTGTASLANINTFSGGVTVNSGTLQGLVTTGANYIGGFAALGDYSGLVSPTTVVTVANGATLAVQSSYTGSASTAPTMANQILSLSGSGNGGVGALRATGGVNSWLGSITLGADATITNTGVAGAGGDVLYLGPWTTNVSAVYLNLNNHALTFNGTGNVAITESIGNSAGDTGSVTFNGGASNTRFTYAGLKNYYTGATNVNSGLLRLQINPGGGGGFVTANSAILGDLNIGSGSTTTTATVQLAYSNQIADNAHVTINSDGILDLATYGMTDVIGRLTLNSGTVNLTGTNNGTLSLGGVPSGADVEVTGTANINGSATGALDLNNSGGSARTFDVAGGGTLNVSARVVGGSLIKDGAGTMVLSADNSSGYGGTTEVRNGILAVRNANALGATVNGTPQAAQTTVDGGATLQLQSPSGNISFASETLVLNGSGYGSAGALENATGNNTWTGSIVLGSDSTIKADTGTAFTISGSIDGSASAGNAQTLTVGGAGNTTIAGPIRDGSGGGSLGLHKTDASTLTLGNVNWFTGAVNVDAGTLAIGINNALGAQTNAVSLAAGTTLALSGGNGNTTTIGALTGTGAVTLAASTNLKVQNASADTFGGTLSGSGLFQKAGAGTFTFASAANTSAFNFAGTVKVDAGTMEFQGGSSGNSLSIGTLTLSGGTLLLTGSYINVGTLNITANTVLDFGTAGASILNASNVYIASGVTLTVRNWTSEVDFLFANSAFRQNDGSGTLAVFNAVGAQPENQVWFQGDPNSPDGTKTTWIRNWGGYTNYEIRPIPEPSTYGAILTLACLAFVGWWRRSARRR